MVLLDRYLDGQHRQVWTELYGVGLEIRRDPDLWAEAAAVVVETMARIVRNLERLRDRLPELGYRFERPDRVLVAPPADVDEHVARVELSADYAVDTCEAMVDQGVHRPGDPFAFVNYLRTVLPVPPEIPELAADLEPF